jgi:hypothetical protein
MEMYGTNQDHENVRAIKAAFTDAEIVKFPPQAECRRRADAGENIMETMFFPLVREADVLMYAPLTDGRVTSGVALEITCAQRSGIPVFEIPGWRFSAGAIRLTADEVGNIMTYPETKEYLISTGFYDRELGVPAV